MSYDPNKRSRGPFLLGFFTKTRQLAEMLNVEDLIPYWNDIYDLLFDHAFMVVQRLDASPFTQKQAHAIWKLMVENMSEDGFPLENELYNNRKFLAIWIDRRSKPFGRKAYSQYKSVLGKKSLESIFGKASMSAFERQLRREKS